MTTTAVRRIDLLAVAMNQTRRAMIATDSNRPDNPIVYANRAFFALTGYPEGEVLGRNCRFLQGPAPIPRRSAACARRSPRPAPSRWRS